MFALYSTKDGYFLDKNIPRLKKAKEVVGGYSSSHTICLIEYNRNLTSVKIVGRFNGKINMSEIKKELKKTRGVK